MTGPGHDIRRAADRRVSTTDGVTTRHCFAFGQHYDPDNVAFGPLTAVNDELLEPGSGFATHRHVDVEIVTWVVSGSLVHEDTTRGRHVTYPGMVQRLSAGAGVEHSETASVATRFIQMWVAPDGSGAAFDYAQAVVDLDAAGWAVVASGGGASADRAAVTLGCGGASLLAARLQPGDTCGLPGADLAFLFVVDGGVELDTGELLAAGDSMRMRSVPAVVLTGRGGRAEILLWLFNDIHSRQAG